jgi:hypothetical protein
VAYRGSLAIAAEGFLQKRIGAMPWGVRRTERWESDRLIHRATDIKTGAWAEVTPGRQYAPHQLVAESADLCPTCGRLLPEHR